MNRERMQHLITVLKGVPPEAFDLGVWRTEAGSCGTAACAVGHATLDPEFQQQGLGWDSRLRMPTFASSDHFESLGSWSAVRAFFGLTWKEAQDLFTRGGYYARGIHFPTEAHVIARIEALLARQQREDDDLAAQLQDIDHARSQE